ncbi:MAG: hypothetical protein V2I27_08740 [Erythrobacter sp.]|nr:hypothetical protein [Erythrobacter sp.]
MQFRKHSYSLIADGGPPGSGSVVELEGSGPHAALNYVQRQLPDREVELFEDGLRLGTVKCTRAGYWVILPRHVLIGRSRATDELERQSAAG